MAMEKLSSLRKIRRMTLTPTQAFCTCYINGETIVCYRKTNQSPCIQAMRSRRYTEDA